MKKRFAESQIVATIKKQEHGIPVKDIACELGISDATFYNWKANYVGYGNKRCKQNESNGIWVERVQKMVAELSLENRAMKSFIEKSCNGSGETGSCTAFC